MRRMQLRIPQAIPQLQKMPIKMVDSGTVVSYGCDFINNIYPFDMEKESKACNGPWSYSYGHILIQA